jgi:undecaprenyl-diphosphatase
VPLIRCAATTWAVYAGSLALARVVRRPRPFETRDLRVLIERPQGPSLPSDQVAAAFAASSLLASAVPSAGPFIYAAAASVGLCRVLAGVHYPGDVVAAALLGAAVGAAARDKPDDRA